MSKFSKRVFSIEEQGALLVGIGALMIEKDLPAGEIEYKETHFHELVMRVQEILPETSKERVEEIVSHLELYQIIGRFE